MASTWKTAQNGLWNVSANWTGGVPNVADAVANFTTLGAFVSPWVIDLGGSIETLGILNVSASFIEHYDFDNGVLVMKTASQARGATAAINVTSAGNSSFSALDSSLTLSLASSTTINNVTAGVFDVAAKITGAGKLTATGQGTLRIDNAANNWTGGLAISGGKVLMLAANALGGGDLNVAAASGVLDLNGYSQSVGNLSGTGTIQQFSGNATLTINETANTTFSGSFKDGDYPQYSGAVLNLTKTGAGTLTLAGTNYTQGALTINQGAIAVGSDTYPLSISSSVKVAAGAKLDLAGHNIQIPSVSGAGSIVNSGPGANFLQLTGTSTFAGSISGAINVQLDQSCSLTLSGVNVYTGTTYLQAGSRLKAGADNSFSAAGAYYLDAQTTIDLNGFDETIAVLSGTGTFTNGAGSSTSSVLTFQTSGVTISSGAIVDGAGGGVIGVDVAGAGQLVLAGANTYSGGTTIEAGATLVAGADNALSANSVIDVKTGGMLDLAGYNETVGGLTDAGTVSSSLAGNVTLTVGASSFAGAIKDGAGVVGLSVAAGAAFHLSGYSNVFSGVTTIGAGATLYTDNYSTLSANSSVYVSSTGSLIIDGYDQTIGSLSGSGTVANVGFAYVSLIVDETVSSTFSGQFNSGSLGSGVSLEKTGLGTLTLSGNNAHAGDMSVKAGTLSGGASNAFTSTNTVIVSAGGTLDLGGYDQTIGNLYSGFGGGTVTNSGVAATTLTLGASQSDFSGNIKDGAGAVALSLAATAVVGLSGVNTYSGLTKIGAGANLHAGATNAFSAASAVTIGLAGVLDLKGYSQVVGAISGTGGITNGASSPSSAVLTVKSSGVTTYSGLMVDGASGGVIGLDVAGTGKLILAGANTYSGATTIEAGATLAAGANNALSANSVVNVKAGGTLDLASYNETIVGLTNSGVVSGAGTLALKGNSTIHTGSTLSVANVSESGVGTTLTVGTLSYAGAFTQASGTLALPGTLTLTGANSLSGKITGTGQLAVTGGNTTIQTGASLSVAKLLESGASTTLSLGVLSYAGALTQSSGTLALPGALTLTGTNSLTGAVSGAGQLAIKGGSTTIHTGATLSVANVLESGASTTLTLGTLGYAGALTQSSGTLALSGTLSLTGTDSLTGAVSGVGQLAVTGGSTTIHTGATLSVANVLESGAGASLTFGTLSYAGALTQSSGNIVLPGTLTLTGTNSITGTVSSSGQLAIAAGSTTIHTGATLSVAKILESGASTTLTFGTVSYGGALTESSGTLALSGTLSLTGTNSLTGAISGAGQLAVTAGSTTIHTGATLSVAKVLESGANTSLTFGALTYAGALTQSAGTINLAGGTLTLTGADSFSGGTVNGSNILLTQGTAKTVTGLTIGGTVEWENTTTVNQSGQVTIGDGAGNMAFLDNTSTGVYDLLGNIGFSQGSSTASYIANAGLLEKTAGVGVSAITPKIINTGTIKVTAGTLDLQGAVTDTGSVTIVGASTLEFDSTVAAGQTMTFTGSGGTLDLGSPQGFSGAIKGFDLGGASNDAIDIASGWSLIGATEGATSTTLALVNGAMHASLLLQGAYNGTFNHTAISGGTQITYTA